jgi:hypothetical protein
MALQNLLLDAQSEKDERISTLEQENARLRKSSQSADTAHSSFQAQLAAAERSKLQVCVCALVVVCVLRCDAMWKGRC